MNFNLKPTEIGTYINQFHESINTFGIKAKYLFSENINKDDLLGEYDHVKYTGNNAFDVYIKFQDDSTFNSDDLYSNFGLQMTDTIKIYVSKKTFENLPRIEPQANDLIVVDEMDNIFEITHVERELDGVGFYGGKEKFIGFLLTTHYYKINSDSFDEELSLELDEVPRNETRKETESSNNEKIENEFDMFVDNSEKSPWGQL